MFHLELSEAVDGDFITVGCGISDGGKDAINNPFYISFRQPELTRQKFNEFICSHFYNSTFVCKEMKTLRQASYGIPARAGPVNEKNLA